MPPKKKKRIKDKEERLEQLGIYEDEEEYDDEVKDEEESWRDVG
jgi:hypothetical protein